MKMAAVRKPASHGGVSTQPVIEMYTRRKLNWQPKPVWVYALGILLLLLAGGLLYLVVDGLISGEIIRMSQVDPGVISMNDDPSEFWLSEMFFFYFVVLLAVLGIRALIRAYKRSRK
jgi:hypothetical protein